MRSDITIMDDRQRGPVRTAALGDLPRSFNRAAPMRAKRDVMRDRLLVFNGDAFVAGGRLRLGVHRFGRLVAYATAPRG